MTVFSQKYLWLVVPKHNGQNETQIKSFKFRNATNYNIGMQVSWNIFVVSRSKILPCCWCMCYDISSNWLFGICGKHGCTIHLSNNLIADHNSYTKLKIITSSITFGRLIRDMNRQLPITSPWMFYTTRFDLNCRSVWYRTLIPCILL